jgi:phosphoketolase
MPEAVAAATPNVRGSGGAFLRGYSVEISPALLHVTVAAMRAGDLLALVMVGDGQDLGKRLLASLALKFVNGHDVLLSLLEL